MWRRVRRLLRGGRGRSPFRREESPSAVVEGLVVEVKREEEIGQVVVGDRVLVGTPLAKKDPLPRGCWLLRLLLLLLLLPWVWRAQQLPQLRSVLVRPIQPPTTASRVTVSRSLLRVQAFGIVLHARRRAGGRRFVDSPDLQLLILGLRGGADKVGPLLQ